MLSHAKWFFGLFLLLLGLGLYMGSRPQKCAADVCGAAPPPPAYGLPGAHAVGLRELTIEGVPNLETQLWYPADATAEAAELVYPYGAKLGGALGTVTIATTRSDARAAAAFDLTQAPYPLVVLSPGFGMSATAYGWLAEHLASHGFVVLAVDHAETLDPQNELWRAAIARPQDMQTLFAVLDALLEPSGLLAGLVDQEKTAVVGHSYGGYTALTAAGAQIDTASFEAHCATAQETADPTAWLCDMIQPRLADMADLAGLDGVPSGLWPSWGSPRVDAVVAIAGDAYFFGQQGLAPIDVPLLAIGGTADEDTPFLWGPQPTFEHSASAKKALFALEEAEHMIFTNRCDPIRWYARPLAGEFCADAAWNRTHAHGLIAHMTTAFLLAELNQDEAAAAALSPEQVNFPNATYSAHGYP